MRVKLIRLCNQRRGRVGWLMVVVWSRTNTDFIKISVIVVSKLRGYASGLTPGA